MSVEPIWIVPLKIHVTCVTFKLFHKIFPYIASVSSGLQNTIFSIIIRMFSAFFIYVSNATMFSRYISIEHTGFTLVFGYIWIYMLGIYVYLVLYTLCIQIWIGNERGLRSVVFIVFLFYPTPSIDTNILFDFIIYSNFYQSIYRMAAFTSMVS